MTLRLVANSRRATRLATAIALAALLGSLPLTARATSSPVPEIRLEGFSADLRATDSLETTAVLPASSPAGTRVRFRLLSPDGRLLVQRTAKSSALPGGAGAVAFKYDLGKLGLRPGIYTLELSLPSSAPRASVARYPLYLRAEKPVSTPFVLIARVSAPPMRDPEGRFVQDPAVETQAIADAVAVADAVIADPTAHVTLAVPPLLLDEWRRVSLGFDLLGSAGITRVESSSVTSSRYATGLERIHEAVTTGRLELLTLGYADPDPSSLARAGLLDDLDTHYRYGLSAAFSSLAATPSAGAAFAGGCLPPQALPLLASREITYGVVGASCVRAGDATVATGAYPVGKSGFTVLVADRAATVGLSSGEATQLAATVFSRSLAGSVRPVVALAELGPGRNGRAGFLAALKTLRAVPWAHAATAREGAAASSKRLVRLVARTGGDRAPAGYWVEVVRARAATKALLAAAGRRDADARAAERKLMIAEDASWAGVDRGWAMADRGRAFAGAAQRASQQVLGRVGITATEVTLSGTRGEIPITIRNKTSKTLKVDLRVSSTIAGVRTRGIRQLTLLPADNYVTVPVDLRSAVSAPLELVVESDGTRIAGTTLTVRASYIDRLAIVGGIVLALGGMLAYIVIRVRRAEREERGGTRVGRERYTNEGVRTTDGAEE